MRFSLATLVLLALWIGALMAVWIRRESWVRVASLEQRNTYSGFDLKYIAPDGRREAKFAHGWDIPTECYVADKESGETELFEFDCEDDDPWRLGFIDDDHFIVIHRSLMVKRTTSSGSTSKALSIISEWRRRFPEWWWGHFYRPEVWLAIALSGLLIWRAIKSRRDTRAEDPSLYQPGAKPQVDCLKVQRAERPI